MSNIKSIPAAAQENLPERILTIMVIVLCGITIVGFCVGTYLSQTGELPCTPDYFCIFHPNKYDPWPMNLIVGSFVAGLLSLPASVMFLARVQKPYWLIIPIIATFIIMIYFASQFLG